MPPLLEAKDLKTWFPVRRGLLQHVKGHVRAVDGVSLKIEEGEVLGLVGESGCGKSTLGRTLIRLIDPSAGSIHFQGRDFMAVKGSELQSLRHDIQMIFQDPFAALNPRQTVGRIVQEPLIVHRKGSGKEQIETVKRLFKQVGLDQAQLNRYPHEFSGGQRGPSIPVLHAGDVGIPPVFTVPSTESLHAEGPTNR